MRLQRMRGAVVAIVVVAVAAIAPIGLASPGSGATTTILGSRATHSDSVRVNDDGIRFQTKGPTDFLTQTITFEPGGHSGWHHHPGVVMVIVESGQLTTHDENCQTETYDAHQVLIESGTAPFMVSNEGSVPAVVYATLVAPAGSPFRIEDEPPACA